MKYLILILLTIKLSFAQNIIFDNEFGDFESASSIDIDLNGNIFIADVASNQIIKLDPKGKEILSIGGYGWNESSFDEPVNLITNTLSVYVADKNNDRIQRFDKDLNFLSMYSGDEDKSNIEFGYPICLEISNLGDLYILESDNNRILKFSLTGEYLNEIGANDAGIFALNEPSNLTVDHEGNIYVLDDSIIKIFDQYGNGKLNIDVEHSIKGIKIFQNSLYYLEDKKITVFNLRERSITSIFENFLDLNDENIVDIEVLNDIIFLLTPTRILKYEIHNN